jgi:hypothetical protein
MFFPVALAVWKALVGPAALLLHAPVVLIRVLVAPAHAKSFVVAPRGRWVRAHGHFGVAWARDGFLPPMLKASAGRECRGAVVCGAGVG